MLNNVDSTATENRLTFVTVGVLDREQTDVCECGGDGQRTD
jgi:hypothetical protein